MSIIAEALKKAGEEKKPLGTLISPVVSVKKRPFNWGPVFVLLVLILITGPIVAPVFSTPFQRRGALYSAAPTPSLPKTQDESADSIHRKSQFTVEESPAFQPALLPFSPAPYLRLTGIAYSKGDSYCLINDKILKVGDTVQDARVVKIMAERVLLDYRGQTLNLRAEN
jgi:type II secretory pathway component PulC